MADLCLRAGNAGALASACPFLRGEDEEGNEITPPVIDERFHANLRCTEEVAELVPNTVIVAPSNPVRVWA